MKKKLHKCPECGSNTVIETEKSLGITWEIERCDGLIDVGDHKPLQACPWQQELRMLADGIIKR